MARHTKKVEASNWKSEEKIHSHRVHYTFRDLRNLLYNRGDKDVVSKSVVPVSVEESNQENQSEPAMV